jgi:DnaK suppressor protein
MKTTRGGYEIYRRKLLEKRDDALSGLGESVNSVARAECVAEDDQAQISHDESISLGINRLDYAQLRLVEEALERIDSGDYGACLSCEEPIAPKRLRALPWARYCIRCQERVSASLTSESLE